MSPFDEKGIFLYQRTAFAYDSYIVELLQRGGFKTVYFKCADGPNPYNVFNWKKLRYESNINEALVTACHKAGIAVVGWGFNYGAAPISEGRMAALQVQAYNLDGWVFDVEQQFDLRSNAVNNCKDLIQTFKSFCPKTPTGYCSWCKFINAHPVNVAKAGMDLCDVGIPMAYYFNFDLSKAKESAIWYAEKANEEWRNFTQKPLVLAGRAYSEWGYTTTVDGIIAFDERARLLGSIGSAWWVLDQTQPARHMDWFNALSSLPPYDKEEPIPVPPEPTYPIYEVYVEKGKTLNTRNGPTGSSTITGLLYNGERIEIDMVDTYNMRSHYVNYKCPAQPAYAPSSGWVWTEYIFPVSS